ncbi:MAG: hypothetical protein D6720_01340 [Gammaproteobacteria bacterium]|nr:MAG: hypothetical protein D6720_01340 [Gammaproteobacteria bacterium]
MKQPGAPIGNGPDLLDVVVMVVLVAFMLTLASQVNAAAMPVQAQRAAAASSCIGHARLVDPPLSIVSPLSFRSPALFDMWQTPNCDEFLATPLTLAKPGRKGLAPRNPSNAV